MPVFSEEQPELTSKMDVSFVMNLADSTSDQAISAEARRIMTQHKKEREKLEKLGNLVPIDTEMADIQEARLKSGAKPLPLRQKFAQSKTNHSLNCSPIFSASNALDQMVYVSDSPETTAESVHEYAATCVESTSSKPAKSRVSKSVGFGIVEQKELQTEYQAPSDTDIVKGPEETSIPVMSDLVGDLLNEIEQNHKTIINKNER